VEERNRRLTKKLAEIEEHRQKEEEEARNFREKFLEYKLTDHDKDSIMRKIKAAFENGEPQLMLFTFPSHLCSDGGRAINNAEPQWPETLPGAAWDVYEFWRDSLKDRGFTMSASIVSFPGGMPGDVGVFFGWPADV
jgi:hypothetical protein